MGAVRIIRRLRELRDVDATGASVGDALVLDADGETWVPGTGGGGGSDDQTAAEVPFTPAGTIAATNVQAAIEEVAGDVGSLPDDLVALAPAASSRNVIQPTAGAVIAAVIKAHASQSVDLLQFQNSSGAVLAQFLKGGQLTLSPAATNLRALTIVHQAAYEDYQEAFGVYQGSAIPANNVFSVYSDGSVVIFQKGIFSNMEIANVAASTNEILRVYSEASDIHANTGVYSGFDKQARPFTAINYEPADADIQNGWLHEWFDATNGDSYWVTKGKTFDGTVVEYRIPVGEMTPDDRQIIAGDGLAGGGDLSADRTLSVNVDGTGIEINSDTLRLKDAGVTSAKLGIGTPSNDDFIQRKAGAWTNRTVAQVLTDLGLAALYQPLDSDLTAIAALTTTSYGRSLLTLADAAAHAAAHASGGSAAIKLDDLAAPDDNTDLNASTSAHGLLKKLSGSTSDVLLGDGTFGSPPASPVSVTRVARSSNTILGTTDRGKLFACTAAFTQTLTAAATLGAGWWCYIKNDTSDGTTVLTIDPNSTETLDGLTTTKLYSGETRLIICDGSNFFSTLVSGGYAKFTPGAGTFVVPAGIEQATVVCVGSGGGGGGGQNSGNGTGGAGGGGGAVSQAILPATALGAAGTSITVTPGTGGAGGVAQGQTGSAGGASTFGTLVKAGGGGGGLASNGSAAGGGGGSTINSGANGTATGGAPSAGSNPASGGASANGGSLQGASSEWGGASGGAGTNTANPGYAGGDSIFGGPGGGGGGGFSTTARAGGAGGGTQAFTTLGGSGPAGAAISGQAGTPGSTTPNPYCGTGGSGGSGNGSGGGGNGGKGGIGAGGGGGGSGSGTGASAGGTGGAGGDGEIRVWYA